MFGKNDTIFILQGVTMKNNDLTKLILQKILTVILWTLLFVTNYRINFIRVLLIQRTDLANNVELASDNTLFFNLCQSIAQVINDKVNSFPKLRTKNVPIVSEREPLIV